MSNEKPRALQVAAYRYNCQPCKQRKTKCDRVKPCASCHLRGTQDKCYVDELDADSPNTLSASATAATAERPTKRARNKNRSGQETVLAISSISAGNPARVPAPPAQGKEAAIREHIAALRKTIDQLESLAGPTRSSSYPPFDPYNNNNTSSSSNGGGRGGGGGGDPVLTTNLKLTWTDVQHLFPPKRDVERVLDYFLREMVYIMVPIQEKQFWHSWQTLIRPHPTNPPAPSSSDYNSDTDESNRRISRCMIGSLLFCLASTSLLIPQRREQELQLTRPLAEQRDAWITSALALVRSGTVLSTPNYRGQGGVQGRPWLHFVDSLTDTSLDRFGFETLAVRIFALLGMSETAYHLNGESLRRAIRISLFDESSPKAAEAITWDQTDPYLTPEIVTQMRRRIGWALVVTERWTCLYTGRPPMIDDEAETLPLPGKGYWMGTEEITLGFSRFVSKLRLLPGQLNALTSRKVGDWSMQRQRDHEAVSRILELDRGLCSVYDPDLSLESLGGRSNSQILAELPEILERNTITLSRGGTGISEQELNQLHREFAEALIMTSSWLSLRCLLTSNLMFLPWVGEKGLRYSALNLARRLIELLPGIWMMASSPYVPFSSSWISRHLFLACTVLAVPILGQETSPPHSHLSSYPSNEEGLGLEGDFAPSRLQKSQFYAKIPTSKSLETHPIPASNSVDLDWFSGKLLEIADLFSKLAERGDQTSAVNMKLIHALLNSRSELRDRVLCRVGEKTRSGGGIGEGAEGVGRIESQRDLTSFVMAVSNAKPSPSGSGGGASPASPGRIGRIKPAGEVGGRKGMGGGVERGASLHDLAQAATDTGIGPPITTGVNATLPSLSPQTNREWLWSTTQPQPTPTAAPAAVVAGGGMNGGRDVLASVPLLLDTQDWLAILDSVDIPL